MSENMESKKNSNILGPVMVFLAGICWGVISVFIKGLTSFDYDSFDIMCFRSWASVVLMFIFFLMRDRSLLKIKLRDIWMFIGTGIFSLTFFSYCYFTSIVRSGAAVAVVLLYTSPIFVMLMSAVVFKEKITLKKIVALILTFIGCVLVAGLIGTGSRLSMGALLLGLGAGFGYALYSIFAGFAVKKYSSLTVTFYTFLFSGITLPIFRNPVALIGSVSLQVIPWIVGTSIICTVLPYLCYTWGLGKMEAGKAAVLVTVEPLVGAIIGILIYHEDANLFKLLGIVLIFSAVILLSLPNIKVKKTTI
ncbi:MAG: DMT family transporter [Lachnospiraceae bacterium]|nr:DMT family transporter [Lachnospiraceae bacterium]